MLLQVVEASAAADKFVTRSHFDVSELQALDNFIVTLPSHAPGVEHGQDSWRGESLSEKYGDHTAWDIHVIVEMLRKFFAASGAVSLPDLDEYEWRQDKASQSPIMNACRFMLAKMRLSLVTRQRASDDISSALPNVVCSSGECYTEQAAECLVIVRRQTMTQQPCPALPSPAQPCPAQPCPALPSIV